MPCFQAIITEQDPLANLVLKIWEAPGKHNPDYIVALKKSVCFTLSSAQVQRVARRLLARNGPR
jgi:hypothetical protein